MTTTAKPVAAFGRFFLPGPTEVLPEILAAQTRPMIGHRGKSMEQLIAQMEPGLQRIFRTTRPVYICSSSATGLMEAAIRNCGGKKILSLVNGAFSERFFKIALANGCEATALEVPLGQAHTPELLADALKKARYDAVTVVHSETSTGALNPIADLARVTHAAGDVLLLVDSVTGVAGAQVETDAWDLDFVLTGSQKALALPPGLALGVAHPRALERAKKTTSRGTYFDLVEFESYILKNQTPNTPALSLMYALAAQVARIEKEGIEGRWARHLDMARRTWDWAAESLAERRRAGPRRVSLADRHLPDPAPGEEGFGGQRGDESPRLHHLRRLRLAQGFHHSYRPHGRSYRGRARCAPRCAGRGARRMTAYRVLVADKIAREGLAPLADDPRFELIERPGLKGEELAAAVADADAVLVRSATKITRESLARATRLKVIGRAGVGVDTIDVEAATERGVAVMNAPAGNTISAAELAFALLLSLVRKVPAADRSMKAGQWDRASFSGTELYRKTLGLVGAGRVGGEVARRARAFGMRVLAYDPYLSADAARSMGVELATLDEVLQQADVISLHVPLTDSTRGLLGEAQLAKLKPTAVIINAARGGVLDEAALTRRLAEGKLAGAAFDVFDQEPLPADHPLRALNNVVLTPHLGASTEEAQLNVALEIAESVRAALLEGDSRRRGERRRWSAAIASSGSGPCSTSPPGSDASPPLWPKGR